MTNKRSSGKILVYCRESRDEGGVFFERIETQRDILLRFVAQRGLAGEVEVILDDGVSGTDFSRLEGVALRAEAGEISTLVFKDASRLGRNLRESLNFLYRMDNCAAQVLFESETYDPELFPLLAWFNERRAAEDSRKVKHVLHHRMRQGGLVFKAPYGYRKDSGKLVAEPAEAAVVRKIFAMRLSGSSTGEIAKALNLSGQRIRRILANRAYTGDMCCFKTEKPSFKSKKIRRKPQDEWLVLENRHEAIISRDDFLRAQGLSARAQKPAAAEKLIFTGILYCGGCGGRMIQRRRAGRADAYVCAAYRRHGKSACESHHIREDALFGMAQNILAPLLTKPKTAELLREKLSARQGQNSGAEKQIARYERAILRIYSDMLERPDQIPRELYEKKLAEYTARLDAAKISLAAVRPGIPELPDITRFLAGDKLLRRREFIHRVFGSVTYSLPGGDGNAGATGGERGAVVFRVF
jgi:DNA invertase Pin-like site-specific DNA recombinase